MNANGTQDIGAAPGTNPTPSHAPSHLWKLIGPGLLVAATGVGAGDLATGALTGSKLGIAVLWAVVLGAFFKFVLNEGLTRWQLATGTTVIEGTAKHLGTATLVAFLVYLIGWSFLVGAALISASGAVSHAMFPCFANPEHDKWVYGSIHSLAAVALIRLGGFRAFERVMDACVAIMFVVVAMTAIAMKPDWFAVAKGLVVPGIPDWRGEGLSWTIALMGGVGGTVTILCYGYWIREEGIGGKDALRICRVDLATGYVMTAIFGLSMIVIGSQIGEIQGSGVKLCVQVSEKLLAEFGRAGPYFKWSFLIGAWCAVFTSLLGVWQSVPYLFSDCWRLLRPASATPDVTVAGPTGMTSTGYRWYQLGIATLPIAAVVLLPFAKVQKIYAIVGALFIPLLAIVLLILNGRESLVGRLRNGIGTVIALVAALAIFLVAAILDIYDNIRELLG